MKQILYTCIILSSMNTVFAQSDTSDNKWFFGISINDIPKNIQNKLDADFRFHRISKMEIPRPDTSKNAYIFFGKAKSPFALNNYYFDSATIFSTCGKSGYNDDLKYHGYTKKLEAEYFFSDDRVVQKLFNVASKEFIKGTRKNDRKKMSVKTQEKTGKTLWITYMDAEDHLRKLQIWKTYNFNTKVYSLLFQELASDN